MQTSLIRVALITVGILSIPFMAMQFNWAVPDPGSSTADGVNWTLSDFIVIGTMIFVTGLLIELALKKAGKYRIVAVAGIVILFLWLWVELAVGLFTNWGS
jgi:hypothetical protein